MKTIRWTNASLNVIALFLSMIVSGAIISACCPHCPPRCLYVPNPPEPNFPDPFATDRDSDGLTRTERLAFIEKGIAATVEIRARVYSRANGYKFVLGSGVFIDANHVLTAEHVVHGAVDYFIGLRRIVNDDLRVGIIRWEKIAVEVANVHNDVALLRVDAPPELVESLPVAKNWRPRKGELLWQFGTHTVWSRGRVKCTWPNIAIIPEHGMIETRMLGHGGDSGGPVVNTKGEVVGIVSRGRESTSQQFFVPIYTAMKVIAAHRR